MQTNQILCCNVCSKRATWLFWLMIEQSCQSTKRQLEDRLKWTSMNSDLEIMFFGDLYLITEELKPVYDDFKFKELNRFDWWLSQAAIIIKRKLHSRRRHLKHFGKRFQKFRCKANWSVACKLFKLLSERSRLN